MVFDPWPTEKPGRSLSEAEKDEKAGEYGQLFRVPVPFNFHPGLLASFPTLLILSHLVDLELNLCSICNVIAFLTKLGGL